MASLHFRLKQDTVTISGRLSPRERGLSNGFPSAFEPVDFTLRPKESGILVFKTRSEIKSSASDVRLSTFDVEKFAITCPGDNQPRTLHEFDPAEAPRRARPAAPGGLSPLGPVPDRPR